MATTEEIKQAATVALEWFVKQALIDGREAPVKEIWVRKDGTPPIAEDLVREAHGEDFLPDDYRYEFIIEALSAISETENLGDIVLEPDISSNDRLSWLASNLNRIQYVDEALGEYMPFEGLGIMEIIGTGQAMEKSEVLDLIMNFLDKNAGEILNG